MVAVVIGSVLQLYLSEDFAPVGAIVDAIVEEAVATVYAGLTQLSLP